MKQTLYIYLMAACALLFAACSDDNLSSPTEGVEGAGALSFTVTGEYPAFEQTPETRSSGIGIYDQGKTQWETGDEILVQVRYTDYSQVGIILTCQEDGTWQSNGVAASNDKAIFRILAVYAPTKKIRTDGNFEPKETGVDTYEGEYIQMECQAVNNEVEIDFSRAARDYSRLRIATEIGKSVRIEFDPFTDAEGTWYGEGLITTITPDGKGNAYLYGSWDAGSTLSVTIDEGTPETFTLSYASVNGQAYTVDCRQSTNLATVTQPITITDGGDFHYRGNGNQPINITGGSPNVYLYNASVSVSDSPAISITNGATPTIHVVGANNSVQCIGSSGGQEGAGIYVASGSNVTIQGSSRNDVLRAQTSCDGAGIGGYYASSSYTSLECGDITIENATVYAYGSANSSVFPGIGSYSSCGTIKIEDATVHAYGSAQTIAHAPAIGAPPVPLITIEKSDIYAHRGTMNNNYNADYIGQFGGFTYSGTNEIQYGTGGSITNTMVYCYTGETSNKTYRFDDLGNRTEQSQ